MSISSSRRPVAGAAVLMAVAAALLAGRAEAQQTISNNGATYTQASIPNSATGTAFLADFRPNGGATTDHLFENWWFYRVSGDSSETRFHSALPNFSQVNGGDTLTYRFQDAAGRFNATLIYQITGQGGGNAFVTQNMTIQNLTAAPLEINLFHYADLDLAGTFNNDSVTGGFSGLDGELIITDGGTTGYFSAVAPTAFQVTGYPVLLSLLFDAAVTNLNNTGSPTSNFDFTAAYQWTRTVQVDGQITVSSVLGIGLPTPIPEPSALALLAGAVVAGLGAVGLRRRAAA
jgi:hypothetical protein